MCCFLLLRLLLRIQQQTLWLLLVAGRMKFTYDGNKKRQWTAFCAKNKSYVEKTEFKAVMEDIPNFLALPARTVQEGQSFTKTWKPGGPWR